MNLPSCLYRISYEEKEVGILRGTYKMQGLRFINSFVLYMESLIGDIMTVSGSESVMLEITIQ